MSRSSVKKMFCYSKFAKAPKKYSICKNAKSSYNLFFKNCLLNASKAITCGIALTKLRCTV